MLEWENPHRRATLPPGARDLRPPIAPAAPAPRPPRELSDRSAAGPPPQPAAPRGGVGHRDRYSLLHLADHTPAPPQFFAAFAAIGCRRGHRLSDRRSRDLCPNFPAPAPRQELIHRLVRSAPIASSANRVRTRPRRWRLQPSFSSEVIRSTARKLRRLDATDRSVERIYVPTSTRSISPSRPPQAQLLALAGADSPATCWSMRARATPAYPAFGRFRHRRAPRLGESGSRLSWSSRRHEFEKPKQGEEGHRFSTSAGATRPQPAQRPESCRVSRLDPRRSQPRRPPLRAPAPGEIGRRSRSRRALDPNSAPPRGLRRS